MQHRPLQDTFLICASVALVYSFRISKCFPLFKRALKDGRWESALREAKQNLTTTTVQAPVLFSSFVFVLLALGAVRSMEGWEKQSLLLQQSVTKASSMSNPLFMIAGVASSGVVYVKNSLFELGSQVVSLSVSPLFIFGASRNQTEINLEIKSTSTK